MSETFLPDTQQYLDISYWTYSQVGTDYVDGPTALPTGFSYLMSNGAPVIEYDPSNGFYGVAVVSSTGQVVVAFEGTNIYTGNAVFTAAQFFDDGSIVYGLQAPSYGTAYDLTETAISDAETDGYSIGAVSLTGHSLGAADAEYVGQQTGLPGTTFGTPGIPIDTTGASGNNFYDYVDQGDPVGNYAPDGNENPILQAQNIAHYGQAQYVGLYSNAALLVAASIAYDFAISSTSSSYAALEYLTLFGSLGLAASEYHPLGNYAADLGLPPPAGIAASGGVDLSASDLLGLFGGTDIPSFDVTATGAVRISGDAITVTANGQAENVTLPTGGSIVSLTSDGSGGTRILPGAASSGYVFAGSNGATIQGNSGSLYFVGGSGPVSVAGGSGNTTLLGGSGASALRGGSGTNLLQGGSGASTLVAGTGASTLIGGSGTTVEFAAGAAPVTLIGGGGSSTINGTTGTGSEAVFTGRGQALIALNGAADSVVGGSGASSVIGGAAPDVYGFINGYAAGSEIVFGLKATDVIVFGGYAGDPITSEGVLNGSDLLTLSDGTNILLQNIDHKVFDRVA
jgi:Ca2+-binding RTX toxin-like protein